MSNFEKKTKRAYEEAQYDKIHSEQEGKPPRGTTRGLSPDEFKAMAERVRQNTVLQERLNKKQSTL